MGVKLVNRLAGLHPDRYNTTGRTLIDFIQVVIIQPLYLTNRFLDLERDIH